ncbi:MAG: hypothetical protein COB66_05920 [Coxiella sp. (in: Bacteria)]|nr:MAG: hypothetical protein COB66_05920 [Coxiella sp. (in: g-proteobacteria)]
MAKKLHIKQHVENEHRFELAVNATGIGVWDWFIQDDLLIWNKNMFHIFNMDINNFQSHYIDFEQCLHEDDRKKIWSDIEEAIKTGVLIKSELRLINHSDGVHYITAEGTVSFDENGKAIRLTGINRDITIEKKALLALQESQNRFNLAVTRVGIGIWDWFIQDNTLIWDDNMHQLFNVAPTQFDGTYHSFEHCVHPDDREKVDDHINKILSSKEILTTNFRIISHSDGIHYISAQGKASYDESGNPVRLTGMNQDITKQVRAELELERLATIDPLTQLYNRVSIYNILDERMKKLNCNTELALFYIDIDNFKEINDTFGHKSGDEFLTKVAQRLKSSINPEYALGRIGGDEFIIIVDNEDGKESIQLIANTIIDNLSKPLKTSFSEVQPHVSIGIAFYPSSTKHKGELIKNADTAMYQAKHKGGNNYQFFELSN